MFKRVEGKISRPPFVVDPTSIVRDTGRQIDWELVDDSYQHGAVPVVATAQASSSTTSISVAALKKAIPAGTLLVFRSSSAASVAIVTATAAVGSTSLTVDSLDETVENNMVAYFGGRGGAFIHAGTVVDLLPNGKVIPSALGAGGGVTAYGILETNAEEDAKEDAVTGYGIMVGGFFYENLLPEADSSGDISGTWIAELRARGGSWQFDDYSDNT